MLQRFAATHALFLICLLTLLPCESSVASAEEGEALYPPIPRVPRDGPFGKDPVAPEGRMVSSDERVGSLLPWSPERGPESGSDFRPGAPPSFLLEDLKDRVDLLDFNAYSPTVNPMLYPYSTHCKLKIEFGSSTGGCSATLIDPYFALTAGHCVYDYGGDGWATKLTVIPAYDYGYEPWGHANGVEIYTWEGWTDSGDTDHDIALIRLDRPLGALAGFRGYGYQTSCSFFRSGDWAHHAYPGEDGYDGSSMQTQTGHFDDCETIAGNWYGYEVEAHRPSHGGTSGGGAIRDDIVWAVRSNTFGLIDPSQYDTRLTQFKFDDIANFIDSYKPTVPNLLPLTAFINEPDIIAGGYLDPWSMLVYNYSTVPYGGDVYIEVYLSDNKTISESDHLLGIYQGTWSFVAGGFQTIGLPGYQIPAGIEPGAYYVGAIVSSQVDPTRRKASHEEDVDDLWVNCGWIGTVQRTYPPHNTQCVQSPVTFQWEDQPDMDVYTIQIGSECGLGILYQTTDPYQTVSTLPPGRWYHWRVKGTASCGPNQIDIPYSPCDKFYLAGSVPDTPTLVSPADGAICVNNDPARLDWEADPKATEWHIQVGTSCGTGVIDVTDNWTSLFDKVGLNYETTYHWRVRGRTGCDQNGAWSACRTFTTWAEQDQYVALVAPVGNAECVPVNGLVLDWDPIPGATEYEIWLGTSGCTADPDSIWTVTTDSDVLNGLQQNTAYWWKVTTDDDCGRPIPSVCWRFDTEGPGPATPTNLEPGTAILCTTDDVVLSWDPVPGAAEYQVQVTPTGGFKTSYTLGQSSLILINLAENSYAWNVRARNTCTAWGYFSSVVSFEVESTPPGDPVGLHSTSHQVSTWSPLNQIDVAWSEAPDNCGMGDYSVVVSTRVATLPDDIPEASGTTYQTPPLADGSTYYVHVRSVDQAGYPAPGAAHLGPFRIDTGAPLVTVTRPIGGATLSPGSQYLVTWTASDLNGVNAITIEYSLNGGADWFLIANTQGGETTYLWKLPNRTSSNALVRVRATDAAGNVGTDQCDDVFSIVEPVSVGESASPSRVVLHPPHPNPAYNSTAIEFTLVEDGDVRLTVLDTQGRRVAQLVDGVLPGGRVHRIVWNGKDVSGRAVGSGIYYCQLETQGQSLLQRILFLSR